MANTKSAIKRILVSEKRRERNAAVKSETRTYVKRARTAITRTPDEAPTTLKEAISALDRAAKKGVIHANNAARRKSRLMKQFNAATAAAAAAPAVVEEAPAAAPKKTTRTRKSK
jgi:small subunit ribosomal protein S20